MLTNKKVTSEHGLSLLDSMFCKQRRQEAIVLLVDEVCLNSEGVLWYREGRQRSGRMQNWGIEREGESKREGRGV